MTTSAAERAQILSEQLISRVPLFSSLPGDEIRHLAQTLRPTEAAPGLVLFHEGERGDRFYIVLDGQIEIIKALGTADERLIGVRGPGEYVGEMSLFNRDGLRTASARTRVLTRALEMTRADFDALLNRRPTLAYEMVRVLSMRLHEAHNTTIRDLREKNRQLTEAYESLQAAQAQIIEKEKLEHELHVAREVQASLLPRAAPRLPGWEFAARWQPAREVSGDFYDFLPVAPAAGRWGLLMADVSDKGMPAALFMALSRSILRASLSGAQPPAQSITQANRLINADAAQGMFVTAFYAQVDTATGQLAYVNAGHNPPWLYRADQDDWLELPRTGMPLGMFPLFDFKQRELALNPGDLLFLYTDGLLDAADAGGERFGPQRARAVVAAQRRRPLSELMAALDEAVNDFRGEQPLFDDITILAARRS